MAQKKFFVAEVAGSLGLGSQVYMPGDEFPVDQVSAATLKTLMEEKMLTEAAPKAVEAPAAPAAPVEANKE